MKKNLVVLELAQNHFGNLVHGLNIIDSFSFLIHRYPEFEFCIKFQFRDIDTFIHPDYQDRLDLSYVKRFKECKLSSSDFMKLNLKAKVDGFKTMATAFDEESLELFKRIDINYIKIASCSFTDWPLLNKIAELDLPIIASTATATLEDIDNVVSFFTHRNKDLSLMHCIGEYPTKKENFELNQIDLLKKRYNLPIGFSTHEDPLENMSVALAVAKGATIFEKHIGIESDKYELNKYSVTPIAMNNWLSVAKDALIKCGVIDERHISSEKEIKDLTQFKRGVFVNQDVKKGDIINRDNVFYAFPNIEGQLLANGMSKYNQYIADKDYVTNEPVMLDTIIKSDTRELVWNNVQRVKEFLLESKIVFPGKAELELSHHYGLEKFEEYGITMITVVNREYCKKLIITLPNQSHPEQYHKQKEETFIILYGEVDLYLDDKLHQLKIGDVITIEPGVKHRFRTDCGCIIEEVSSTHYTNDSYYIDETIIENKNRKTFITHWI